MEPEKQLIYLLEHYYKGEYTTDIFVDEFYRVYNFEIDDFELSEKESELLSELSVITGRFSSNDEDLKITNMYFCEKDVKEKATSVYLELYQE